MPATRTVKVITDRHHPGVSIESSLSPDTHDHCFRHYGRLVGLRIKEVQIEDFEGQALPVLIFKSGPIVSAAVMMDPEGNGPGHLDIITR